MQEMELKTNFIIRENRRRGDGIYENVVDKDSGNAIKFAQELFLEHLMWLVHRFDIVLRWPWNDLIIEIF